MGKCKDCRFWKCLGGNQGLCSTLLFDIGTMDGRQMIAIYALDARNGNGIEVPHDFGCVHFGEKPKCAEGPFSIIEYHPEHSFPINPHFMFGEVLGPSLPFQAIGSWGKILCAWLNKLWAQRECEGEERSCLSCRKRHKCGNCGTYAHCVNYGRVCSDWSPKC
jgi:hypothetical protein